MAPSFATLLSAFLLLCITAHASAKPSISEGLKALHARHTAGDLQQHGGATTKLAAALSSHVSDDMVRFTAAAVEGASAEDLKTCLASLGAKQLASYRHIVSGWVPMDSINTLDKCKDLHLMRESLAVLHQQSRQGSRAMSASLKLQGSWRRPVKVGVMSDSFNSLRGYAKDIASNALPKGVQVLFDYDAGTDEGRAMLQLVHAVAPDANLAFHTTKSSEASFAGGILALAEAGCRVIVDDVSYLYEPMFQNGIIAQAVNYVRSRGVAYFSASGNEGFVSYSKDFVDSGVAGELRGSKRHQFGVQGSHKITSQLFGFGPNITYIVLNWDQPFYSVSGGAGCRSDVNMYVHTSRSNESNALEVLYRATTPNIGGDAQELLVVNNDSNETVVAPITVEWVNGVKPGVLQYVVFSHGDLSGPVDFITNSATCYGHMNAAGSVAVGAVDYQAARAFTGKTSIREYYSSAVGTPLLFSDAGKRLPKPQLVKSLIMAPDGLDTTFFPPPSLHGRDTNGDLQPEFRGTSAAAPNAAAVAALLFGTAPKGLTVGDVVEAMYSTAEDMDDPRTPQFDCGWDYATGYGMINATRAAEKLNVFTCKASA
eukprot:jgi/Chlat1/420/Chrsp10S00048